IPSGAYFIWPINMDLSGPRLVYATAQPITRIAAAGVPIYVFGAQKGIAAEFAIDGVSGVIAQSGHVAHDAASGPFVVSDFTPGTSIDVRKRDGGLVRMIVLSPEQTDNLSVVDFDGERRLVLTDAQLFVDDSHPVLLSTGKARFRFSMFPAPSAAMSADLPLRSTGHDGVFQTFEANAPAKTISVNVTKTRDALPVPPL